MLELNKLYLGDCMDGMKEISDKYFDLILTDPPYGVNLNYSTYDDTEENWFNLMKWFYKNHTPDWLVCWYKGSTGCNAYVGFNDWEPLIVYGKTKPQLYMHDYISVRPDEKMGNYGHPCPKPLLWAEKLICMTTNEGDKVLDTFTGSGTTLIACHNTNRQYMGFELDPDYHKAATERLEAVKAQMRLY